MNRRTMPTLTTIALLFLMVALPAGDAVAQQKPPPEPLVPNNTLLTATPEEGRALAIALARRSIQAMQNDPAVLKSGRLKYSSDPNGLIAASHVVAVEFATIAAANHYWQR